MRRRGLLATLGAVGLAGCSGQSGQSPPDPTGTIADGPQSGAQTPESGTAIHVGPEGSNAGDGSSEFPLGSINAALSRAQPGDTVRVAAGRYEESIHTVRAGAPSAPITITGPPDAIVTGDPAQEYADGCMLRHSHVHIRGLTFDGLKDPSAPDDPQSYMLRAVTCIPAGTEYLHGVVIKPHAVGNARGSLIDLNFLVGAEVGEFRVIGPAGLNYLLTDRVDHWGEIVYVGQAPGTRLNIIDYRGELQMLDTSNDIHIHHIDNSAGHHHAELVNTKLGTHDVLVEYCTDGGGSQNTEPYPSASIRLQSHGATVRWCDLRDGHGYGVDVGSWNAVDRQAAKDDSELTTAERLGGRDNAIYGNRITGFDDGSFSFPNAGDGQTPDAQRYLCENEFDGSAPGDPGADCPEAVPTGEGIGHTGGDSPWP